MIDADKEELNSLKESIEIVNKRMETDLDNFQTETDTRNFIINPILNALGYDIQNPNDIRAEYGKEILKDSGTKDRIDYLIKKDNKPIIIIEAKSCTKDLLLGKLHLKDAYNQVQSYFLALIENDKILKKYLNFAIITNGIKWIFYLKSGNKTLQNNACFEFNIKSYKEADLITLLKFNKRHYSFKSIERSLLNAIMISNCKNILEKEIKEPNLICNILKKEIEHANLNLKKDEDKEVITSNITDAFQKIFDDNIEKYDLELRVEKNKQQQNQKTTFVKTECISWYIVKAIASEIKGVNLDSIYYRDYQSRCFSYF